jgi:hypothetical protein
MLAILLLILFHCIRPYTVVMSGNARTVTVRGPGSIITVTVTLGQHL